MSRTNKLVDYDILAQALSSLGTDVVPAELEGIAYGFVCLHDARQSETIWAKFLLEEFQDILDDPKYVSFLTMLGTLFRNCQAALEADDLTIQLCLPDDDASLDARIHALGAWCKGFMYGLGLAGKPQVLQLPDIQEALGDLSSMIDIAYDPDDVQEDEKDYAELVEYVRMVPFMIFQQRETPKPIQETIH